MNRLLAALPEDERERVRPMLQSIDLEVRHQISAPNAPPKWVYFPTSALISSVAEPDGEIVEVATIGNEGIVGVELLLWGHGVPFRRFVQIAGSAERMTADDFLQATASGPLRQLALRYAQALHVQVAQTSACARLHPVEHRLARWLLLVQDRIGGDRLSLTQEFVGQMLGVRRASVSIVAGQLERAGYIRHSRGVIEVVDRGALEAIACCCYQVIRDAHECALELPV